ncbi:MAG: hypothetical protein ACSHXK_04635 [Oceanococcus sp.]
MTTILTLKLLHILGFVYWLGGDLGTFFASRFVVNPELSPAQRGTALKIMLGCDQGPKLCMPLTFALGYSLSQRMGFIGAPVWLEAIVWGLALLWFANVNYLYFTDNQAAKARLSQIDLYFRMIVVTSLLTVGILSLLGHGPLSTDWLSLKIMIFAGLVACGIYIRIQLKPFVAAFMQLMTSGSTAEVEATLSRALGRCRPAVYLIWIGLIVNAALGLHLLQL